MTFAGSTKAHQKSHGAGRQAGLIHRRHHRGIKQSGRLDRVFHRKACADEPTQRVAELIRPRNMLLDHLKMLEKDIVDIRVQRPEVALHAGEDRLNLALGNRQQPFDNVPDPVFVARSKEPGNNPF